ncbi:MAG: hypothetical protein RR313_10080 [Anaerovoracaceae bacterium]
MNKNVKKLLNENNELEKEISKESNELYTNMIVYMRVSQLSAYNQEVVRRDIANMVIDGEKRGETIDTIIGGDYKSFCEEIIKVFPPKTKKEKTMETVGMLLMCLYILFPIVIIKDTIKNIMAGEALFDFTLTLGDVIDFAIIVFLANFIVNKICKGAFEPPAFKNKIVEFIAMWGICVIIIGVIFGVSVLLKNVSVTFNVLIAVIISLAAYIANKKIEDMEYEGDRK